MKGGCAVLHKVVKKGLPKGTLSQALKAVKAEPFRDQGRISRQTNSLCKGPGVHLAWCAQATEQTPVWLERWDEGGSGRR